MVKLGLVSGPVGSLGGWIPQVGSPFAEMKHMLVQLVLPAARVVRRSAVFFFFSQWVSI